MSNQHTLLRIEKVFERVKKLELTFGEHASKKRLADRTIQTYCDVVKAYTNYLYREHGIADISRAKPRHAYEYIEKQIAAYKSGDKNVSAYTMRRFVHAIHAFREASAVTGVYKSKVKIGDKREILARLNEEGVVRRSRDSKTLMACHEDYAAVHLQLLSSHSPNADVIAHIHQIQRYVGARISEAVSLRKQDIAFHSNDWMTVTIKGKGGLIRHVDVSHKSTIELLRRLTEDKKEAAPVFQMKNSKGQDKSIKQAVKSLKENIRTAANRAGVDRSGKTYTSHSARKAFAQARMDMYAEATTSKLHREIARRIAADPSLKMKYERTLQNVRAKLAPSSRNKNRELNHKELCAWLVSTDLGHGRLDVIRYYCRYSSRK